SYGLDSYGYDNVDRLTSDVLSGGTPSNWGWGYDAQNRISQTFYQVGANQPTTTNRNYDTGDELRNLVEMQGPTMTKKVTYNYDLRENRIFQRNQVNAQQITYGYDAADRLSSFTNPFGVTTQYAYNGDGLRSSKTQGGTQQFLWDTNGGSPLLLADGSANYVYRPGGRLLE